jgi:hypothetical protein
MFSREGQVPTMTQRYLQENNFSHIDYFYFNPKSQPQNIVLSSTNSGTDIFLNTYINMLFMLEI